MVCELQKKNKEEKSQKVHDLEKQIEEETLKLNVKVTVNSKSLKKMCFI